MKKNKEELMKLKELLIRAEELVKDFKMLGCSNDLITASFDTLINNPADLKKMLRVINTDIKKRCTN